MATINSLITKLLKNLEDRKREVLISRFGLLNNEAETLQAIGDKYNVTRERIRQIESLGLSEVREVLRGNEEVKEIFDRINKYLDDMGGVSREDKLIEQMKEVIGKDATLSNLSFLREASKEFGFQPENNHFYAFWYNDEKAVKKAKQLVDKVSKALRSKKEDILGKNAFDEIFYKIVKNHDVPDIVGLNYLSISKRFCVSPYGDFGLSEWSEVNPSTIRDWSYLVLKKHKAPLHFEEIAQRISEIHSKKRKVFTPTVHNELIKDPRFVLVGRGIYGLTEFGYEPGGIKDLLVKILREKGPMRAGEVVKLVCEQRMFKKNTVMLHLQDRKLFSKNDKGHYQVSTS